MNKLEQLISELCPNGVEYRKLEKCCNILDRQRKPVTKSARETGEYPYYGANGLVFVYPLYELASYAEGMPELVLPYYATAQLIKLEYLPSLPQYPSQ